MDKFLFGALLGVVTAMTLTLIGRHDNARLKYENACLKEQKEIKDAG